MPPPTSARFRLRDYASLRAGAFAKFTHPERFAKVPLAKIRRSRPVEIPLSRNWKNILVHRRGEKMADCWAAACGLGIYAGGHAAIALECV